MKLEILAGHSMSLFNTQCTATIIFSSQMVIFLQRKGAIFLSISLINIFQHLLLNLQSSYQIITTRRFQLTGLIIYISRFWLQFTQLNLNMCPHLQSLNVNPSPTPPTSLPPQTSQRFSGHQFLLPDYGGMIFCWHRVNRFLIVVLGSAEKLL